MLRRFSVNFAIFSIGMDVLVIIAALIAATQMRPHLDFLPFAAHYPDVIPTPWPVFLIFILVWVAIFLQFSIYDGRRNIRAEEEFVSLTMASLLAGVAIAGTLYLTFREISRLLFITFLIIVYLAMVGWRVIARLVLHRRKHSLLEVRRILIVGSGSIGQELHQKISKSPLLNVEISGYLDDPPHQEDDQGIILGAISEIQQVVVKHKIDDVMIALPGNEYQRINQLVGQLHSLPVKVWIIPDYFRLALYRAVVEDFAGMPMIDLRAPALSETQRLIKRVFDLIVSLCLMPLFFPLMGAIALAVWLQDREPAILRQERVGENGRLFTMYKFRTMIPQTAQSHVLSVHEIEPEATNHKRADDPRITRLGRILRRTSLDELPQLINVIKGDMSLVGPRPELPFLVDNYETWQRQRFAVPQGITGWWQIQGRSDKPMHLNTEDDIYYVQNHSIWLDIYILLKTIGVVIQGTGAF